MCCCGRLDKIAVNYTFAYRRYSLPFRTPLRTAHGLWTRREGLLARLEREDGGVGFGECAPIPWFGTETVAEATDVCATLGARVSDEQIGEIDAARYPCLRFALGRAKFSAGLAADASQDRAARTEASPYLPVAALVLAGRVAVGKISALADDGFRAFKWKVGAGDMADELALLDDVCAALPQGARLRLDANGAWDRRGAERWLSRCVGYPVEFIEQPVAADAAGAEDLLLGLAADYPVPIALDESVVGAGDVGGWLDLDWPGIYVIKPSLLGDVDDALKRLPKSRTVFSSAIETGVGAKSALNMAFEFFAGTEKPRALGFGVWPLFEDARFDGPRAAPFVRAKDLERLKPEILWNALN
ncbi:o-succinylbenzoate synthase [Ereboglobus luteus]|uniref:o-succinylbenzoate synthase n=1 Tax=Ereboglobus luteus TaxID=1796921 RepID=A0A2U8E6E2_9BACT|nr:o-succinylbenzoate synthase [Ereboglobus luteus]AWI10390.1 o-succinylbenzoate synthase [Ereboglobus luteus]